MSKRTTSRTGARLLTTRETATALGVHERTLRRYITSGLLGYRKLPGGHYRIPEEAIRDFWRRVDAPTPGGRRRLAAADQLPTKALRAAPKAGISRSHCRRLSEEGLAVPYDLSPEALAALRAHVRASDG